MTLTDPDLEPAAPRPIIRYANLTGAEVRVIEIEHADRYLTHVWACLGCLDGNTYGANLDATRTAAAKHAAQCRALPPLTA